MQANMQANMQALASSANDTLDSGKQRRMMVISVMRLILALLLTFNLAILTQRTSENSSGISPSLIATMYAMVALVAIWALLFNPLHWRGQLFAQLLMDVVLLGLLVLALGGSRGGYAIVIALPIVAAASLLSWTSAMFICSMGVLILLIDGLRRAYFLQQEVDWFLIGMQGLTAFGLMAVMRFTAARAESAETINRKAQLQAKLVQELQEQHIAQDNVAWLVLDAQHTVQVLNGAARTLAWQAGVVLEPSDSLASPSPLSDWLTALQHTGETTLLWPPGNHASITSLDAGASNISGSAISQAVHIKASVLPHLKGYTALTLELNNDRQARHQVQHLAAMGRISASIAHEIRNPLAAISQAAELLKEGISPTHADASLFDMIVSNTGRIDRIVHNLLASSHGVQAQPTVFEPVASLAKIVGELRVSAGSHLKPDTVQFLTDDGIFSLPTVFFDTDHLYQIISNLLSNALRYASGQSRSICVRLHARGPHIAVLVLDDGPAIDAKVQQHLFEPFQSASKQGTGLGLFLSREYAQANQGSLQLMLANESTTPHGWVVAPYTKAFVLNLPVYKNSLTTHINTHDQIG